MQGINGLVVRTVDGPAKPGHSIEALREGERKHSPSRVINGAQLGSVLQGLRNVPNHQAQHASEGGPSSSGLEKAENQKGKDRRSPKGVSKASVNGKKDFIRARLHKAWSPGAIEGNITQHSSLSVSLFEFSPSEEAPLSSTDGDRHQGGASKFQFSAKPQSEMGIQFKGCGSSDSIDVSCREPSEFSAGCGVLQTITIMFGWVDFRKDGKV